ncbi:MAG: peptidoglycan DD-metalloendopeptidase family protein [Gaiellaceae bacterium]
MSRVCGHRGEVDAMVRSAPWRGAIAVSLVLLLAAASAPAARAIGDPAVAALQVALVRQGLYHGPIDGLEKHGTKSAVRAFQRRHRLIIDGVAGPQTRTALGSWASHELGQRELAMGMSGWDVAELQFLLAWHGFPSAGFNGNVSWHVAAALKRFQRNTGLPADGIAGARTFRALRTRRITVCPVHLGLPVRGWLSSPYGPRWLSFHPGVDLAAPTGTPVVAAASGRVSWSGLRAGGWGRLVVVQTSQRIAIFYAHLSKTDVTLGQHVKRAQQIGLVGSSGNSTGPHLYLEVRVDNAAVDPLPALEPQPPTPPANS